MFVQRKHKDQKEEENVTIGGTTHKISRLSIYLVFHSQSYKSIVTFPNFLYLLLVIHLHLLIQYENGKEQQFYWLKD